MRPIFLLSASAFALAAAACSPGPIKPRAALDCPQTQGDLTRTGAAADGKSCTYVSDDGAEVTLQLVAVQGGAGATLNALEAKLLSEMPPATPADTASAEPATPAPKAAETPAATGQAARDAAAVEREAQADARGASLDVKVDVDAGDKSKGVTVDGTNDKVKVDIPGIHVEADEATESARVRIGPLHIDAGEGGATIRNGPRSVRLKGEQLSSEKRGIRASFIYTGDRLPSGYRYVGYEAAGPKTGPLAVALVRGKSEGDDHGGIASDITRLVRKNGGV